MCCYEIFGGKSISRYRFVLRINDRLVKKVLTSEVLWRVIDEEANLNGSEEQDLKWKAIIMGEGNILDWQKITKWVVHGKLR